MHVGRSLIFWNITPCGPMKVKRNIEGMYNLHIQGRTVRPFYANFLIDLFFNVEYGGDISLRNIC
jgi:hypothetical protein